MSHGRSSFAVLEALAASCAVFAAGCAPLPAPDVTSPVEVAPGDAPELRWTGVEGATFSVEVCSDGEFKADVLKLEPRSPTIDLTGQVRAGALELGRSYNFRVSQRDGDGTPSMWSNGTLKLERFSTPLTEDVFANPTKNTLVNWGAVSDAPSYRIQIAAPPGSNAAADDDPFQDKDSLLEDRRVIKSRLDLLNLLGRPSVEIRYGVAYPYRVAVEDPEIEAGAPVSEWSETHHITFEFPPVAQIEDVLFNRPLERHMLNWSAVKDAQSYDVAIFTDKKGTRKIWEEARLDSDVFEYDITRLKASGRLRFGVPYYWQVLTTLKRMPSRRFVSELRTLRIDLEPPTPRAPIGAVESDQLPNFQWIRPGFEDVSFEVWVSTSKTGKAWKRFGEKLVGVDATGIEWSDAHYDAALRLATGQGRFLDSDQPELFDYGKIYYWKVRTVYGSGASADRGEFSKPVRFRLDPPAPKVEPLPESVTRLTPFLVFQLDNWKRLGARVKLFEVEVVGADDDFTGDAESTLFIAKRLIGDGVNRIALPKRLQAGFAYKIRMRTVFEIRRRGAQLASRWIYFGANEGTFSIPPNPREQFPTGLIDKTETVQEWYPVFNHDSTQLAYQAGWPAVSVAAFGDAVDRVPAKDRSQKAGSIFTKAIRHDERGMPIPTPARGSFKESWEQDGVITFLQPAWTPDGKQTYFASPQYDTKTKHMRSSILSKRGGSPAVTSIVRAATNESLAWPCISSDGKRLTFTLAKIDRTSINNYSSAIKHKAPASYLDRMRKNLDSKVGQYEIWTSRADGSGRIYLTPGRKGVFSPDGSKIAYMSRDDPGKPWGLWVCGSRGGNLQQLVAPPQGTVAGRPARLEDPCWSHDGTKIAYASNEAGNDDIWIYELETGKRTQVTGLLSDDRCPVWGKDDKYIVFVSDREEQFDLWYVEVGKIE